MIKNIILDMGNVLLDYDPEVSLNRYCSSEEEKNIIRKELFQGPEWVMADRGDILDSDRYDLVCQRVPEQYHEALKNCCLHWDICMKPLAGAREFCAKVREKGLGLYVLSNASDLFYRYFPNFLPFDYFDGILVSSDVHLIKPDIRIYELMLETYQLTAEECLFIDDRLDNVNGAIAAGIQGYQFRNDYDTLCKRLDLD